MSRFGLKPPPAGLSSREYREYVKNGIKTEIARIGVGKVLEHESFVVLYSGPSRLVRYEIGNGYNNNSKRSVSMILELKDQHIEASRINSTSGAVFLNGQNLRDYFEKRYSKKYSGNKLDDVLDAVYAKIWGGISELFADLDFKTVATAVCGAGQDRVFVRDELPVLVKNPHVKTINKIDMQAVRDMYNEVSPDEAFRLVCLSELKMTLEKAQASGVPPTEGWRDFFERHLFYSVERDDAAAGVSSLTTEQKERKEKNIEKFGLQDLFHESPIDWARPHKPPAHLVYTQKEKTQKPQP